MNSPIVTEAPRRFLYINVSRIGDTLLATPAIRAIAAHAPGTVVDVLGHPKRVEVLENLPFVRKVGGISKNTSWMRGWFGFISKPYDVALVHGNDEALIEYALRVSHRVVAFRQQSDKLNSALFRCIEPPQPMTVHTVEHGLMLANALNIETNNRRLAYQVTPAEANWAADCLTADLPASATPLIGMHIATFPKKTFRRWPIDHFAQLADRIAQQWPHAYFIIYGGNEEPMQVEWLIRQLKQRATTYAGRLSLRQTAALMNLTDLHIGLDTGPTHLVSAFDIPVVSLHHCQIPSRFIAPLDHPCSYPIDHPRLGSDDCSEQVPMSEITVETVFMAVQRALSEHPPKPR